FICKEPKLGNQKRLYEHYAGIFPTFQMFRAVLQHCTKNYGCLVIDNSSTSDKIEDQVFWYRSDLSDKPDWDNFRLCYPVFWKNNEKYLLGKEKEEEVAEEDEDYSRLTRGRNQINFNVKQII